MKNTAGLIVSDESPEKTESVAGGWRTKNSWFALYLLLALAAIFYLPRLVPTSPSASDSYLFGYNNRIGIILLFVFVAGGAIWTRGLNLRSGATDASPRLQRKLLWGALGVAGIGCGVMYVLAGRYNGFGESFYLIDRLWLLHQGRVPYRDFEFAYGPAQLYGPLFLQKFLHLALPQAYYLFWALSYLVGTYFLFKAVDKVKFATTEKLWIFSLLFVAGLFATIRMGTNYTFLRYALPVYLVIVIQRRFKDFRAGSIAVDVLMSVLFTAILMLLSPETAVAFAFASFCVCLFTSPNTLNIRGVTCAALFVAYGGTFRIALKLHVLDAMLADGGGAISFPILPGPHVLVFIAAMFVCACYLYRRAMDGKRDNSLGLIFFSIPMAAAALSRCDPSHVFWNGLAAFMASLLYLSIYKRAWLAYSAAFLLLVVLLPNLSELYLFVPQLRSARFFNKHPDVRPSQDEIEKFLAAWQGDYIAPFGYRPDGFGTYHSPRIEFGRFEDLIDVSAPRSVEEKVSELRDNPGKALLLPYHADEYCRTRERAERHFLETLLLFPYVGRIVHADNARQPICGYMDDHYRMLIEPSAKTYWYGIWVPDQSNE